MQCTCNINCQSSVPRGEGLSPGAMSFQSSSVYQFKSNPKHQVGMLPHLSTWCRALNCFCQASLSSFIVMRKLLFGCGDLSSGSAAPRFSLSRILCIWHKFFCSSSLSSMVINSSSGGSFISGGVGMFCSLRRFLCRGSLGSVAPGASSLGSVAPAFGATQVLERAIS